MFRCTELQRLENGVPLGETMLETLNEAHSLETLELPLIFPPGEEASPNRPRGFTAARGSFFRFRRA